MHCDILTKLQKKSLSLVKDFSSNYYLVGGTAIALHIGHRHSIDFDLFTSEQIDHADIMKVIDQHGEQLKVTFESMNQLTGLINEVKFTFYQYPYNIPAKKKLLDIICLPDLLDLAAMKAFALGRRAKWKDYVDLYFIFKNFYSLSDVNKRAETRFGSVFNGKLFRQQLSYFADINYSESIDYLEEKIDDQKIKDYLVDVSTREI